MVAVGVTSIHGADSRNGRFQASSRRCNQSGPHVASDPCRHNRSRRVTHAGLAVHFEKVPSPDVEPTSCETRRTPVVFLGVTDPDFSRDVHPNLIRRLQSELILDVDREGRLLGIEALDASKQLRARDSGRFVRRSRPPGGSVCRLGGFTVGGRDPSIDRTKY
jgi:hypothetical protein